MPRNDSTQPRLYLDGALSAGTRLPLSREQANYLLNVLRLGEGDRLLVFNGRDGEWQARLAVSGRKSAEIEVLTRTRAQPAASDLWYLFAPLKSARLDYMVQKAVEMGASQLQPVMTRRTQVSRINLDRMRANAIEAAEQCGILTLPAVSAEIALERLLAAWPRERRLIFCDEDAPKRDPLAALKAIPSGEPMAVVIGPEGGFDESERAALMALPGVIRLSLGPRILRADTAAVAALALVQAVAGDF